MQILVTGASGRIGRYVVKELVSAGHSVTGVDVLPSEEELPRFLRVDLTDAGEVYQALATSGAEAVVHLTPLRLRHTAYAYYFWRRAHRSVPTTLWRELC